MNIKCTRGYGVITDPETGKEYNVERDNEVEVDPETAERLKANFSGIVITETDRVSDEPEESDLEGVSDEHWRTVVSDVEAGEYDDRLDELAEVDTRSSVQDAIEERR